MPLDDWFPCARAHWPDGRPPFWQPESTRATVQRGAPASVPRARAGIDPPSDSQAAGELWCRGSPARAADRPEIANELTAIGSDLSPETTVVASPARAWDSTANHGNNRRKPPATKLASRLAQGRNWDRHTAQLHRGVRDAVLFHPPRTWCSWLLVRHCLRPGHVQCRWQLAFSQRGASHRRARLRQPFDLDEFRSVLDHKVFRSADMVSASERDVEEFTTWSSERARRLMSTEATTVVVDTSVVSIIFRTTRVTRTPLKDVPTVDFLSNREEQMYGAYLNEIGESEFDTSPNTAWGTSGSLR